MTIEPLLNRVRDGRGTSADFLALESWLSGDQVTGDLYDAVSSYLWFAPQPKYELIVPYLAQRSDPMIVAAAVSGLATRGYNASEFTEAVFAFAAGEQWDAGNDLRVTALLALPKVAPKDARSKALLSKAAEDESPTVRDCAVTAAQQILGTQKADLLWGKGVGDLIDRAQPEVRAWLGHRVSPLE